MIAYVRGSVAEIALNHAVVEVGGVGLQLLCTPGTLSHLRVGTEAHLSTSFVVREDSMTLFGFSDADEKACFEILQTASGVGPKLAQAVLSVLTPQALRRAIADEDAKALTRVPGVGAKGAAKIVIELKDRIGAPDADTGGLAPGVSVVTWREQVSEGLVGLGWSAKEADKAVDAVAAELGDSPDVGTALRTALRLLGRG